MPRRRRPPAGLRPSLLDFLADAEAAATKNKYCSRSDLSDEATVEAFFVSRLISDLGYRDDEIRPKAALDEITVARGRRKEPFRPDYVLFCAGKPRWLLDAKAASERPEDWVYQGAGYALGLNRRFSGENPCQYFVITNGLVFNVYRWDEDQPALELSFPDFVDDNLSYVALRELLGAKAARLGWRTDMATRDAGIVLRKPGLEDAKKVFAACHRLIWKSEKLGPQPAFFEFVKVMFVKLWEDRKLHEDPELGPRIINGQTIPKDRLVFSTRWVDARTEDGDPNPIDRVLFRNLAENLELAVVRGHKKPIFEQGERINLHAGTLRRVVNRLETYDMFGIDEDLNGRLFEAFLNATMRGRELGQYFTPRSVVKLTEALADLVAGRERVDRVLDACCGTGGFLIEALTNMRNQVRTNGSLSEPERTALLQKIANEALFGIDAGKQPPLARIARINMYLHGDGGSRIYAADSLDKELSEEGETDPRALLELAELKEFIKGKPGAPSAGFDVILTNPPFAMDYSQNAENEARILNKYALARFGMESTSKVRQSLRSSIMFIERYADLLKPGGRLLTVIDDSILSGRRYAFARDFIRDRFVVRAVVSLPGDAFQRAGARAKTSILYLVRRQPGDKSQPDVFMTQCSHVGLDDVPMKTRPSKAKEARERADEELRNVVREFGAFLSGQSGPWRVAASRITDRLDVKWCLPRTEDVVQHWSALGLTALELGAIVDLVEGNGLSPRDTPTRQFTLLRVRYDGVAERGDVALGSELTYATVRHPTGGHLVVSNINAAHGSTCVVPEDLQDCVVTSEFTELRVVDGDFDPWFLWAYLRSTEARARLVSTSTGVGRHRVTWDDLKALPIPKVDPHRQRELGSGLRDALDQLRRAESVRAQIVGQLASMLDLENEWAVQQIQAAKPPR